MTAYSTKSIFCALYCIIAYFHYFCVPSTTLMKCSLVIVIYTYQGGGLLPKEKLKGNIENVISLL